MLLDTHSHVLPDVDDGAKTVEETVALLEKLKEQGVTDVIATPHMRPTAPNGEEYYQKIHKVFDQTVRLAEEKGLPRLHLGYEVAYFYGMANFEGIGRYTMAGTDKILLELPFEKIQDRMVEDILEMSYRNRLLPIFAHLERYLHFDSSERILQLVNDGDALAQITATAADNRAEWRAVKRLITARAISFVGSDTHSTDRRPPQLDLLFAKTEKTFGKGFEQYIDDNNRQFLAEIESAHKEKKQ